MTSKAEITQSFYIENLDYAKSFFNATSWDILKQVELSDSEGGLKIRLFKDDHPLAPITVPDPDPDDFDANGVGPANADGLRRLKAFEEYSVQRQRNALDEGNLTAYKVARDFNKLFMWADETGEYETPHTAAVCRFVFDAHAFTRAWWMRDREFAMYVPRMEGEMPYTRDNIVRGEDGKMTVPGLVLLDSLDEDSGSTVFTYDKITPARAVEIAKEALDIALHDAGLAGWDEFGGDN